LLPFGLAGVSDEYVQQFYPFWAESPSTREPHPYPEPNKIAHPADPRPGQLFFNVRQKVLNNP